MTKTEKMTLQDAVREFTSRFGQISGPLFKDLIEAKEDGCLSYESDVLTLLASPTFRCSECSESGDIEEQDVVSLNGDPVLTDKSARNGGPASTIEEALAALESHLDNFREYNILVVQEDQDGDVRAETDEEVLERLRDDLTVETKYVCGCGAISDEAYPGEPQYAFPVAWNTMFHDRDGLIRNNKKAATDAGFFVFESEYYDGVILGVDGGGYSFHDQHFTPLYKNLGLQWHDKET